MKPFVLENIQIELQWPEIAVAVAQDIDDGTPYLGEVDPQGVSDSDPLIVKLLDIGKEYGLIFEKQNFYTGSSYLPLRGSVPWHNDDGIGLLLNWIVASKNLEGYTDSLSHNACHLLTRHGQLEIKAGDIFVFNGNAGHAWISNSQCMLVQTTVKATRSKRGKKALSVTHDTVHRPLEALPNG
jgi:hypothetical protein